MTETEPAGPRETRLTLVLLVVTSVVFGLLLIPACVAAWLAFDFASSSEVGKHDSTILTAFGVALGIYVVTAILSIAASWGAYFARRLNKARTISLLPLLPVLAVLLSLLWLGL